jgi:hypothetical protein
MPSATTSARPPGRPFPAEPIDGASAVAEVTGARSVERAPPLVSSSADTSAVSPIADTRGARRGRR